MKLAIFDFDGTLLTNDTLPCLGREWLRQKRSKARYITVWMSVLPVLLRYKLRLISRESMKRSAFRQFNRLFIRMTRQDIEAFFNQAYPNISRHFNPAVLEEIRLARQEGFHSVLLSGTYEELLKITAQDLGVDTVIGAKLAYKDDVFDHRNETPFIDGKAKRQLLLEVFADKNVDWRASRAFGDSYTDIFIIETVGERIAVNPDSELLSHARRNNWKVVAN